MSDKERLSFLQPGMPVSEAKRIAAVLDVLDWLRAEGVKVNNKMKECVVGVTGVSYRIEPGNSDHGALHLFTLQFGPTEVTLSKRETRRGKATLPLKVSLANPYSQLPPSELSPITAITQFRQRIEQGPDVFGMTFIDESTGYALRVSSYGHHQVLRIKA